MAAYHKVEVSLNANAVEVGIPSPQTVNVVVPTIGPAGPAGATGATGATGAAGQGVPVGGTAGQVLRKASGTNYDTEWATGGGGGVSSWNDLTDKPATFPPSSHTHPISEVTNLQTSLDGKAATSDARLSDSREWSASTIDQAEAEAGTATTRRAFTALRVFQAIAAWWAGSSAKTKLDGIASGATANATDAQLRDRNTHTGTQAANTITGLAAIATSGSASDLASNPTLVGDVVINGATTGVSGSLKVGNTTSGFNRDVEINLTGVVLRNAGSSGTTTIALGSGGTSNHTLTPPNASGTIALQGAITTSGLTQSTARLLGRTDASTGPIQEIQIGSGLSLSAGELSATASGGVTTGSVDNAIIRADGTGGSTSQSSAIIIEDAVSPFGITGVASTDVITATGHNFTANQAVRFPTLTGGSGLTAATTNYFVRDISGDTFKVSASSGGAAVNFTTDITAGTVVAMQEYVAVSNGAPDTNSSLVLSQKGTGAIMLQKPDGTTTGGNSRGVRAVDLQMVRTQATHVASGENSFLGGGRQNTASGLDSVVLGGNTNVASGYLSLAMGGITNTASGQGGVCIGTTNTASSNEGCYAIGVRALADRATIIAQGCGQFAATGDAQRIHVVLRCRTTTNSAVEMLTATNLNQRLTIPSGKVMSGIINITGVKSDGATVAHYIRRFSVKNVAGTSSAVYTAETIGTDVAAGTSITFNNPDTNDALSISVTGIASETWRWVATVDAVEVAYGT